MQSKRCCVGVALGLLAVSCASTSGQAEDRTARTDAQAQATAEENESDARAADKAAGRKTGDEQVQAAPPPPQSAPGSGAGSSAGAPAPASPVTGDLEAEATALRHELLFGSSERYDVSGKLAAVNTDRGEITIQREGLPPALLNVAPQTRVQVDGQQSSLDRLEPGGDVRASFNLSGRRPIALEIEVGRAP